MNKLPQSIIFNIFTLVDQPTAICLINHSVNKLWNEYVNIQYNKYKTVGELALGGWLYITLSGCNNIKYAAYGGHLDLFKKAFYKLVYPPNNEQIINDETTDFSSFKTLIQPFKLTISYHYKNHYLIVYEILNYIVDCPNHDKSLKLFKFLFNFINYTNQTIFEKLFYNKYTNDLYSKDIIELLYNHSTIYNYLITNYNDLINKFVITDDIDKECDIDYFVYITKQNFKINYNKSIKSILKLKNLILNTDNFNFDKYFIELIFGENQNMYDLKCIFYKQFQDIESINIFIHIIQFVKNNFNYYHLDLFLKWYEKMGLMKLNNRYYQNYYNINDQYYNITSHYDIKHIFNTNSNKLKNNLYKNILVLSEHNHLKLYEIYYKMKLADADICNSDEEVSFETDEYGNFKNYKDLNEITNEPPMEDNIYRKTYHSISLRQYGFMLTHFGIYKQDHKQLLFTKFMNNLSLKDYDYDYEHLFNVINMTYQALCNIVEIDIQPYLGIFNYFNNINNKKAVYLMAVFLENYYKIYDLLFIRFGSSFSYKFDKFMRNKHKKKEIDMQDIYEKLTHNEKIYNLYEYKFS